jgi:hypothetical protein
MKLDASFRKNSILFHDWFFKRNLLSIALLSNFVLKISTKQYDHSHKKEKTKWHNRKAKRYV